MINKVKVFGYIWWIIVIAGVIALIIIPDNNFRNVVLRIIITIIWAIIAYLPFYPPFRKYMGALT